MEADNAISFLVPCIIIFEFNVGTPIYYVLFVHLVTLAF